MYSTTKKIDEKLLAIKVMQEMLSIWFKTAFAIGCILNVAKVLTMRNENIETLCTKVSLIITGTTTKDTLRKHATSSHSTHSLEYKEVRKPNM